MKLLTGPCLVDNNIFLSRVAFQNAAQGTAYVHNLICGSVCGYKVLNRATPYHYPHSTDVAGYAFVYGGDDRVINNIIIGNEESTEQLEYFGKVLDEYSVPEEYMPEIKKIGIRQDQQKYYKVMQPVWVCENAYSGYAKPFRKEVSPILTEGMSASIEEKGGSFILTLSIPDVVANACCEGVDTKRLGMPRITEERFEDAKGKEIFLTADIVGASRNGKIIPGAIANLKAGVNLITVWKEN